MNESEHGTKDVVREEEEEHGATVKQKLNISSLFPEIKKDDDKDDDDRKENKKRTMNDCNNNQSKLPPSCTAEDLLGDGVTENDLYRFLEDLDEMAPTIPDQFTNSILKTVGVEEPDVRVTRLISLAAQKFMQQIADDCYKVQANKLQALPKDEKARKINQRVVLTPETLGEVLSEYGVSMKKPQMFVGSNDNEMEDEEIDLDTVDAQQQENDGTK